MINLVLLKYEIRKLIFTKKYFYMMLLLIIWTVDILMRLIINGFRHTAPFSQWSYTEFINLVSPILLMILILLCTSIFSEREKAVRSIIYSTPIAEAKYYMMKGSAITIVFIITAAIPILISFVYYVFLFEYTQYQYFIVPILLFMIPCSVFIFGLSIVLGRISGKLLYALAPLTFIMGTLNLHFIPTWLDLFGNNLMNTYAISFISRIDSEVIPYVIPNNFIYSRVVFAFLGIFLFAFACRHKSALK